ncbi:hypothetical protein [Streptomyces sp. SID12488]|uniref:hypothetical protein n=1 Tax=Streptomyces sp. SID12488 TaxID=2706040 RepID=UPI0013DB0060|nr:hypothetical protein [Streptomyces sp. SID12488]NEA65320.1 hypothetical protein [Streptomyces sp. SID12488]
MTTPTRVAEVDNRLGSISQILSAAFVAVAGIGTAFGLSQDTLIVAVNNDVGRFWGVAFCALGAIALSIGALFCAKSTGGNVLQLFLLILGVLLYLTALLLAITFVAEAARSNGRPNLSDVKIESNKHLTVSFTVHADGVPNHNQIIVEAEAVRDNAVVGPKPLYRGLMRPDDLGDVEQKVSFLVTPGDATSLIIRARPSGEYKDGTDCDATQTAKVNLSCAVIQLPK